jgi:hypothetical protein
MSLKSRASFQQISNILRPDNGDAQSQRSTLTAGSLRQADLQVTVRLRPNCRLLARADHVIEQDLRSQADVRRAVRQRGDLIWCSAGLCLPRRDDRLPSFRKDCTKPRRGERHRRRPKGIRGGRIRPPTSLAIANSPFPPSCIGP